MTTASTERRPEEVPARIEPLTTLPLFHNLAGRKVVLTGAGDPALWKAELLVAAGAELLILAGSHEGAARYANLTGRADIQARPWTADDLTGAALLIHGEEGGAETFVAAARSAGMPVNVIDNPKHSDFTFGTIVNRSPLVIGIFSGGHAPMLGQSVRERLEALLPAKLAHWAKAAGEWRPEVKTRIGTFEHRRAFWKRFVDRVWSEGHRLPEHADRDALLNEQPAGTGEVLLVGAGPGDPSLLTLGALRALQRASVILYDDLVGPEILELARREARRVAVGKKGYGRACSQADINSEVVRLALEGDTVVRLKGGDPLIFGRAGEELDACRDAGVPVTIIPGISAGQAAGAAIGVSLTERELSRRVQFVTAHGSDGKLPTDIDWTAIADAQATTIVYMPRRNIDAFIDKAAAAGLDRDTPVALVASASLPTERRLFGRVRDLPQLVDTLDASAPLTIIIGQVARERSAAAASNRAAA
ncbi:uroporphyrinogen-III C-methyltransferase [Sphingomonas piscis]|uniref:Uroporphyrinogen-III C-methyltransferase n=1 Tax=Sphingomonas piscis TaxID=2714943 RepID=A0A6G7YNH9_9SPHN|nr:siroheme synthase CysG [Sphingomonas piscis]QIK78298.1 uroporphyrinogen-III C-methyltransferase [Sphingomonas piscis]